MKNELETEKEDLCHVLLSVDKARWAVYQLSWSKMRQNDKKKKKKRSREVEVTFRSSVEINSKWNNSETSAFIRGNLQREDCEEWRKLSAVRPSKSSLLQAIYTCHSNNKYFFLSVLGIFLMKSLQITCPSQAGRPRIMLCALTAV